MRDRNGQHATVAGKSAAPLSRHTYPLAYQKRDVALRNVIQQSHDARFLMSLGPFAKETIATSILSHQVNYYECLFLCQEINVPLSLQMQAISRIELPAAQSASRSPFRCVAQIPRSGLRWPGILHHRVHCKKCKRCPVRWSESLVLSLSSHVSRLTPAAGCTRLFAIW